MNNARFFRNVKEIAVIIFAAFVSAVSVQLFLLPNTTIVGGILGIASTLDLLICVDGSAWYLSAGVWVFALNIPIVIYCFYNFSKRFAVKTLLYVTFLSLFLVLLRVFDVSRYVDIIMTNDVTKRDKVLYVLVGGILHGLSLPLMLSVNASTGGSDILAMMMQRQVRRSSSDVMRIILATNVLLLVASSVVLYCFNGNVTHSINLFIYSVSAMFIGEVVQEYIFKGFSSATELEITTDKPEEMSQALQQGLKHGVTAIKVVGGYSHQDKTLLLCVVNKSQLTLARKIVHDVDENAFAYVENVKEVLGKGFVNKEVELDQVD